MRDFEVKISKTFSTTVKVRANTAKEAEEIISQRWLDGEYELEDDHVPWGAEFTVKELERERIKER